MDVLSLGSAWVKVGESAVETARNRISLRTEEGINTPPEICAIDAETESVQDSHTSI